MSDEKPTQDQYDPPQVEQIPTESGPAVTAAGESGEPDTPIGPEWQPDEGER